MANPFPAIPSSTPSIGNVEKYYENFEPPPEAPTFTPDEEDFKDPLSYIAKIKPIAERYGVVKIKPPESWQPPFVIDIDKFVFNPRLQKLNELEALSRVRLNFLDSIARFWHLQGSQLRVPVTDGRPVDLYKLHKLVKGIGSYELACSTKRWSEIARKMSLKPHRGPVLREHYERILLPFDMYQSGMALQHATSSGRTSVSPTKSQPSRCSSAAPLRRSAPLRHRSRMRCAMSPEGETKGEAQCHDVKEEPTEKSEREMSSNADSSTNDRRSSPEEEIKDEDVKGGSHSKDQVATGIDAEADDPMDVVFCKICRGGEDEDLLLLCDTCDQSFHTYCLLPPLQNVPRGDWRCPKCITDEVKKPTEAYGFAQAERTYSLNTFGEMADKFKSDYFGMPCHMVPLSAVEKEFWRLVTAPGEGVTVEYGADLLTDEVGSGFPRLQGVNGMPLTSEDEPYAKSPWNLNNLPSLPNSVLSHISVDISGMKVPWAYVGMCFSTFCWHTEDHWSYSINYLHWGEPKTWYGASGLEADEFERSMKEIAPELFAEQPDLLHHLVTMTNPRLLMEKGVKIYTINQCAGEFVVTFPRAYHCGFNQGYNFAEAVNFCPADWLAVGRNSMMHYGRVKRLCVFAHDELICKIAAAADLLDMDVCAATSRELGTMIEEEKSLRQKARSLGVVVEERHKFECVGDDERLCKICRTTCFSSAVTCGCETDPIVCLRDVERICLKCTPAKCVLRYRYTIDELEGFLLATEQRTEMYDSWRQKVTKCLASGPLPMEQKPMLAELKQLSDEAKREHYPQRSGIVSKLLGAVKHAERCAGVAEQLIMQKIRTRQRQKNSLDGFSGKLRLDEVETFVQQLSSLLCRIPQIDAILDFVEKVKQFKTEAAESSISTDTNVLSALLDRGIKFDLQLPEIPKLKAILDKRRWTDAVDTVITGASNVRSARMELTRMRSLLDEGVNLVAAGIDVEQSLARLQAHLLALENEELQTAAGSDHEASDAGHSAVCSPTVLPHAKRSGTTRVTPSKRPRTNKQSREGASRSEGDADDDSQRCSASTCQQPSGDEVNWVQCEGACEQWFHIACVNLTLQTLDTIDRYTCQKCTKEEEGKETVAAAPPPLTQSTSVENSSLSSSTVRSGSDQQQLSETAHAAPVEILG